MSNFKLLKSGLKLVDNHWRRPQVNVFLLKLFQTKHRHILSKSKFVRNQSLDISSVSSNSLQFEINS